MGPLPGNWLAARMADLTPDLQECLYHEGQYESFHSLRSLSVSCFQVILGLPGPRFPLTCMSKAVLTALLERSTCPYQLSLLSFSMRSRSSIPSRASSSMDLMVAVSCGLTLQICLIISLQTLEAGLCYWPSFTGMEHCAPHTHVLYTRPCVLKERWREERTGFSSLNFFQTVFTRVVVENSQPPAAESMSPR